MRVIKLLLQPRGRPKTMQDCKEAPCRAIASAKRIPDTFGGKFQKLYAVLGLDIKLLEENSKKKKEISSLQNKFLVCAHCTLYKKWLTYYPEGLKIIYSRQLV